MSKTTGLVLVAAMLASICAAVEAQSALTEPERVHVQLHEGERADEGFHVSLTSKTLGRLPLHLFPLQGPRMLSAGLQVLTATDVDSATGTLKYDTWEPTLEEIELSHAALYTDVNSNGVFHVQREPYTGEVRLAGIVNGMSISHDGTGHVVTAAAAPPNMETRSTLSQYPYVAELFIVCDKDFSALFGYDRQRIVDYFTIYMWDVSMRFRTLPSISISFQVNGILIINSTDQQPFIEQSRDSNGAISFTTVIQNYSKWLYQQLPNWTVRFDLSPLVTNTSVQTQGGYGQISSACGIDFNNQVFNGVAVWNDAGDYGSATILAHELGHTLGVEYHDDQYPNPPGCADRGYIMMANGWQLAPNLQWFFSSCSDNAISSFVQSSAAACLKNIDGTAAMDPGFVWPMAPTMDSQCTQRVGATATVPPEFKTSCLNITCRETYSNGGWYDSYLQPVDNTLCDATLPSGTGTGTDNGRCFRGNCRPNSYMFYNVGTNICMRSSNTFTYAAAMEMYPCNWPVYSPPDRFAVLNMNPNVGQTLQSPYEYNNAQETGEACAVPSGTAEGDSLVTDRCGDHSNPNFGWTFRGDASSNSGKFLLVHTASGRCARAGSGGAGATVTMHAACDSTDNYFMWQRWI